MENFEKIIEFAIAREEEAAKFYRNLQNVVKLDSTKEILAEFEKMEYGHVSILKSFKPEDVVDFTPEKILNLKISDSMVEPLPSTELSFQDVLIMAMKREEAATKLYNDLANNAENENVKKLFLKLAEEESKHKFQLENIYEKEIYYEN